MVGKTVLVADSSALIELDRRGLLDLLENFHVVLPPAVKAELVDRARATRSESPAYRLALASAHRFEYRIERGGWEVLKLDYAKHGRIIDRARRRLAKLKGTRVDRTPKADAEMAGAIHQLRAQGYPFRVLVDDETLVDKVLRREFPDAVFASSEDLIRGRLKE